MTTERVLLFNYMYILVYYYLYEKLPFFQLEHAPIAVWNSELTTKSSVYITLQGNQNHFNTNYQNRHQQNSESQDDKQIKRERRRPSKCDNSEEKVNGQQDFQNSSSNSRNKIAEHEANTSNHSNQNHKPHCINKSNNQGFNHGGHPKGGHAMPGMMGPGPGGPRGPHRGNKPRGPPPGNFNDPFGQPGPPRGPRRPGMDDPPPFRRDRWGFQERGPSGNRDPTLRPPFEPRIDGYGPRGPGGPGWNPRPCGPGGPVPCFNPRMGGPGPRGPFPHHGAPDIFNRPPPSMGQRRWQRPPH